MTNIESAFSKDRLTGRRGGPERASPPAGERSGEVQRRGTLTELLISLLTPVAALAGALGVWRLAADAGWTRRFFIADGLLSHWWIWLGIAVGVEASASIISRLAANWNREDSRPNNSRPNRVVPIRRLRLIPKETKRLVKPPEIAGGLQAKSGIVTLRPNKGR